MSGHLHPVSKLTLGSLITLLSACEMGMAPMGTLVIEPEDTGASDDDRGKKRILGVNPKHGWPAAG